MKVILVAVLSADGFIGRGPAHTADWSGREDKRLFAQLTKEMGVMVMGAHTFATIGRALPERRNIVYTTHPERITAPGVEATAEAPADLLRRLEKEGATGVAICGGAQIYTMFMKAGLVDELYLSVRAIVFGQGVTLFNEPLEPPIRLLDTRSLDHDTLLMHYALEDRW